MLFFGYSEKDAEIESERGDLESFKRRQQRSILQLENELEVQRAELSTGHAIHIVLM